jgi:hypothetical protein
MLGHAQFCSQKAGPAVEMQIRLSFDDRSAFQGESANTGSVNVQNDAAHRGGSASAETRNAGADMQIRVQLQDAFGSSTLQESSPGSDGRVTFRVCSKVNYRVRVFGPDIDEALVEGVDPGRTDRIMNIMLHHKRSAVQPNTSAAMVSARRLQVPAKAQKELEKGDKALKNKKLADARRYYTKAIELYPGFDEAENNLGITLMQEGDRSAGKAAFERAVAINDHFAPAYVNLAKIAVDEKRFTDAYALAKQALATEPLSPGGLFVATEAAFFTGDYNQTVGYTHSLHSLPHKQYALAHFLAAKSLEAQNQPAAAIGEYQNFLTEDSLDPNAERARERLRLLQLSQAVASQSAPK